MAIIKATTVSRAGKPGDRSTRRGGGNTWEKQQSQTVAQAAREIMEKNAKSPMVAKTYGKNVIADGERRMSISASKNREDPGGAGYSKGFKK